LSGEIIGRDEDGKLVVSLYGGDGNTYKLFHCTLAPGSNSNLGSMSGSPDLNYLVSIGDTDYPGEKLVEVRTHQYGAVMGYALTGVCYFDSDNNLHLKYADEIWVVTPCITP
jgi:hypothetical protein